MHKTQIIIRLIPFIIAIIIIIVSLFVTIYVGYNQLDYKNLIILFLIINSLWTFIETSFDNHVKSIVDNLLSSKNLELKSNNDQNEYNTMIIKKVGLEFLANSPGTAIMVVLLYAIGYAINYLVN